MILTNQNITDLLRITTYIACVVSVYCWQNGVEDIDKVNRYPRRRLPS